MSEETGTAPHGTPAADRAAPGAAANRCCTGTAPAGVNPDVPAPCCGTVTDAQAAGACCAPVAKATALAAGAGCCG